MAGSKLIFGCGYLGLRVARSWRDSGPIVVAVTRSPSRAVEFARESLGMMVADVTRPESLEELSLFPSLTRVTGAPLQLDTVLFAVGYDRTAEPDIYSVYAHGLQNVLAALPPETARLIYISTTGVYGTAAGEWVDETTPPDPQRDGGRASFAAEEVLRRHPLGARSVILRLAGIYGPGRVPYLDKLRAGEPLAVPSAGWLNLIHVDDAARVVLAADTWLQQRSQADGPQVFCVGDGAPVARADYYAEVARLIGAPPPSFCRPPKDSPAATRAAADRRVSNRKMLDSLELVLRYPNYRLGLAAILDSEYVC
jgi:nucleoside-diphosphate-sugar epimerase